MRRKPNFWFLLVVTYLSTLIFAGEGMLNRRMTVPVEVTYNLNPTDSRVSATEAARMIARQDAASRSGTYIEGVTELENGRLSESIKEVQTSVVRLTNEQTEFSIPPGSPNGQLTLSAIAEVDTSTLETRIKALQKNRDLSKKVQALARENTHLRSELKDLHANGSPGVQRLDLERRRLRLESQISENSERLLSVFDGGTLLDFRENQDAQVGIKNQVLERKVLDPLLGVQVYADIDSATGSGTHTTARIRVNSEPAPAGVMHQITGMFVNPFALKQGNKSKDDYNRDLRIQDFQIERGIESRDDFNIHAMDQLEFLQGYLVATEVQLGSEKRYLPVLGINATSFGGVDCEFWPMTFQELMDSSWTKAINESKDDLRRAICAFNSEQSQSGSVEITVTNEQAAGISSVTARRVLIDLSSGRIL